MEDSASGSPHSKNDFWTRPCTTGAYMSKMPMITMPAMVTPMDR